MPFDSQFAQYQKDAAARKAAALETRRREAASSSPMAAKALAYQAAAEAAARVGKRFCVKEFRSREEYSLWLQEMSEVPGFEPLTQTSSVYPHETVLTVTYRI